MSKPSILLIPGSFSLPEFYNSITKPISGAGYEIRTLHYPSIGLASGPREGAPPTMYDDAAFIAAEAEKLADEGKDVILVAHSYGGVPTTESVKGLSKQERQKQGKKGGIVRIAYVTSIVPAVGMAAMQVLGDLPKENQVELKIDENGWMFHDPALSAPIVFSDLPKDEGEAWMRKFPTHSAISFVGALTYAGYNDVPVNYLVCEDDNCIPVKYQREGIQVIEQASGRNVEATSIRSGHCPNASQPQKVVDWILDVAGKA